MHLSPEQIITFLLSISIMLLFAKVLGELFIKIKQPSIIGEILAGILLGPTVLGLIYPDFFNHFFPQNNEIKIALDGITTIAVILLLLVSGLEVDLSVVLKYGKVAVSTSLLGIIVPFTFGFGVAYFFPGLMGVINSDTHIVFSLFIGTAIAISSLPVIAKILMDLNIFKTQVGFIIIAAAMLNDLVGWLIFSIILGLIGAGKSSLSFGETIFFVMLFVVVVLIFVRKISNRLIPVIQKKFSFPGAVLNFILIMGFLGAAFTEYIGVHAILGAFIVGIAVGDSVHIKEETREIIQQFVTNIFAPLFFVSIGLRVNFITSFNLTIVIVILAIALIGKIAGSSIGARIGGLKRNESLVVGFGMSSSGAMGIIIGLLALQYGIINEELFVAIVIMALFTSMASAPFLNYFLKAENKYKLNNLLKAENLIFTGFSTKLEVLTELVNSIKSDIINKQEVLKSIIKREEAMPTGIANYLAIPHVRIKSKEPIVIVAVNKNGIDFNPSDNLPTKIIILLLTPEENYELQLKLLSEITSKFSRRDEIENLLSISDKVEFIDKLKSLKVEEQVQNKSIHKR
jgi:Kef-type K+ transport system membrane component KefB/mannitol/fructose-specific phosphotransferase system IIA component (Ntr-type)